MKALEALAGIACLYVGAWTALCAFVMFSMRTPRFPMRRLDEDGREITTFMMANVGWYVPFLGRRERHLVYTPLRTAVYALASLACLAFSVWIGRRVLGR